MCVPNVKENQDEENQQEGHREKNRSRLTRKQRDRGAIT